MLSPNKLEPSQHGKQKRANIGKKVLEIPNQKSAQTGPTNSAGKSFSIRSECTVVAVGKSLLAQSVKSQYTGTKSTWQTKGEYYTIRSNWIQIKRRKHKNGTLLKNADKMFMKQKMTKNRKQKSKK